MDSFVRLKSENTQLGEENSKLKTLLKDMRDKATAASAKSGGRVTTIPIPGGSLGSLCGVGGVSPRWQFFSLR